MYTRDFNRQCDGWARTSFDECKLKCQRNELPDGCNTANRRCAFAVWEDNSQFQPGWCHLADENCVISENYQSWVMTGWRTWKNPYY